MGIWLTDTNYIFAKVYQSSITDPILTSHITCNGNLHTVERKTVVGEDSGKSIVSEFGGENIGEFKLKPLAN